MGLNVKQAIMDTARHLFGEQGFQNTSMRDIAKSLNISVGNLTYHYKKKEDLIEAIILEDHEKYQKPIPFFTLKDFETLLQRIEVQKKSRPYYFKHFTQLSQICPTIYEIQVSVLQDLNDVLTMSFENFVNDDILKREFSQEYSKITDTIMSLIVYGLPNIKQIRDSEEWLNCVWSIIVPCLTEKGGVEYKLLQEEFHILSI